MLYSDSGHVTAVEEMALEGRLEAGTGRSLSYCLKYPFLHQQRRISNYYLSSARAYERVIKGRYARALYSAPAGEYEVSGGFEVSYNKGRLLSVYMDTYENMGPYRTGLGRTSCVWDVYTSRKLDIGDLFRNPAQVRRIIAARIDEGIAEGQRQCSGSFYFGIRQVLWDWYLTERGLAVYFQPETIAPRNAGLPSFLVTWDKIGSYAMFEI